MHGQRVLVMYSDLVQGGIDVLGSDMYGDAVRPLVLTDACGGMGSVGR